MTEIYLTISLSTHNGDDTPQKCDKTVLCLLILYLCWLRANKIINTDNRFDDHSKSA